MSAVGFDIGNNSCIVAVAKHTGIVYSIEEQCFLGIAAGASTGIPNPKDSISQIMRLISRPFSDPELQQDLKALPFSVTEGPDGFPLIHACYGSETRTFTPTVVMRMVLSNMKKLAEKNSNGAVVDCCIGIPIYFTDLQRRAVMDAAKFAGLNPLRLMHETTATALAYGIYKTDLPENEQVNVAFVDIRPLSMQVCIAGFKKGELKILAHSFDRRLGGRDFDEVLFNHFAEKFKADYKIDVFQNANAFTSLRGACENLKSELRSNLESPLYIECFINKRYVRGFIKRDEFEQLCSLILERVKKPLEKALSDAQLTVDDNYVMEVVGSDAWVIKILPQFFGKQPRGTMNSVGCVYKGCVLECAILSPNYKVRKFQVQDRFPFPIAVAWKGFTQDSHNGKTEKQKRCTLFPKGSPIPSVKAITFNRSGTFTIDVLYADVRGLETPPKINTFTIGPFQSNNGECSKVKVIVRLDLHGIVNVESAKLSEEGEIVAPIPVSKEPLKETTNMGTEKDLTDVEVYECVTHPNTKSQILRVSPTGHSGAHVRRKDYGTW